MTNLAAETKSPEKQAAEEVEARVRAGWRVVGVVSREDAAAEAALDEVAGAHGWGQVWFTRAYWGEKDGGGMDRVAELVRFLTQWNEVAGCGMAVLWDIGGELRHPEVAAALKEIARAEGKTDVLVVAVGREVRFRRELEGWACTVEVALPERRRTAGGGEQGGREAEDAGRD